MLEKYKTPTVWNKEKIIEIAKGFKTVRDFCAHYRRAWVIAKKQGFENELGLIKYFHQKIGQGTKNGKTEKAYSD